MPLVRIDVVERRRTPEQLRMLTDTAQDEQKRAMYAELSRRLGRVVGNTCEDWSFGLGRAQFLEGDL